MDKKIISFDLGTGGNKASLYDAEGNCLAATFVGYEPSIRKLAGTNSVPPIGGKRL